MMRSTVTHILLHWYGVADIITIIIWHKPDPKRNHYIVLPFTDPTNNLSMVINSVHCCLINKDIQHKTRESISRFRGN